MELRHISHEHPLILNNEMNDEDDNIYCDGCFLLISGSSYSCTQCQFFLHKICGELPSEMKHPMHPQHPLNLQRLFDYAALCYCDVCDHNIYGFTYRCAPCDFDVDIRCAVKSRSVEHESHKHPLSIVLSPASFECHACLTKREGISYLCKTCEFWIHEDCALLPTTTKHSGHIHPLTLFYSFPFQLVHYCVVCEDKLDRISWIYYCEGCDYVIHANCSTKAKYIPFHIDPNFDNLFRREKNLAKFFSLLALYCCFCGFRESKTVIMVEDLNGANSTHLPLPDESVNLIAQFVKQITIEDNKREADLTHFSHNHRLTLSISNEQTNDKTCEACVQPISLAPFYSCSSVCSDFFLHKWCAELPNQLQHPCHPHPLLLIGKLPTYYGFFYCDGCSSRCNGFSFKCAECNFYYLDVKCASLPRSIVHEAHEHPLLLRMDCTQEGCAACHRSVKLFSFGCGICNFNLHYLCAMLPRTFTHRYDEHPFTLIYSPIKDGPDEYYCEFCEEEIEPQWWFYHCVECDQSACADCIREERKEFANIKFGGTFNTTGHPHALNLVQVNCKSNTTICNGCHESLNFTYDGLWDETAFKCVQCNIMLRPDCAGEQKAI